MEKKPNRGYTVGPATPQDVESWMALVLLVATSFPGLDIPAYRETLSACVRSGSAICAKQDGRVVGALLFSQDEGELSFIAVHPACRRLGIARALVEKLLAVYPSGKQLSVTTYRENDPAGTAARALYQTLGFEAGALVEEFGYPCQRFVRSGRGNKC